MDDNVADPSATAAAPQWDEQSRASATAAAKDLLTLYGQTTLSAVQWWAQLEPHTSEEAAVWFESIDPRNVPTFTITGAPELVHEETTAWLAQVQVPTDVGIFTVLLSRGDSQADWLLERVDLPADLS